MEEPDRDKAPTPESKPEAPRPRFQFTIRTLLLLTAGLALVLSGLSSASPLVRFSVACSVLVIAPSVPAVMIVYGRGYLRTFSIGALIPSGLSALALALLLVVLIPDLRSLQRASGRLAAAADPLVWFVVVVFTLSVAAGLLAMLVRWVVESDMRSVPGRSLGTDPLSTSPPRDPVSNE